jgi:hypothetical protein
MLAGLLGSVNKERVLVYLAARETGHARAVARFFGVPLSPVQKAADALEVAGVLAARDVGSTREYRINPRYPGREELRRLVERALSLYPKSLRDLLLLNRSRPRRKGKPL